MKLFLLRHANARDTFPDHERELSDIGWKQLEAVSNVIDSAHFCNVAQIWHSPYLRAVQTATAFKENLKIDAPLMEISTITPEDNPYEVARMASALSCFGKDLMIVSHNPLLENLTDILLDSTSRGGRVIFDTCALACLTWETCPETENDYGVWSLGSLISPRMIRA